MEKSDLMGRFTFDGAEGIAFWIGDSDTEPFTKVMFDELETLKAFIEHNLPGMFGETSRVIDGRCAACGGEAFEGDIEQVVEYLGEPNEHCCKHPKCPGDSLCCCQGEPNDEREAKAVALAEWQDGNPMRQYSEWYTSWEDGYDAGFSRASVSDAATEGRMSLAELEDIAEIAYEYAFFAQQTLAEAEDERDAALAAVERVRAIAETWRYGMPEYTSSTYQEGQKDQQRKLVRELLAALDGAPEPEVKP